MERLESGQVQASAWGPIEETSPSAVSGEWPGIGIGISGLGLYHRQEWVF